MIPIGYMFKKVVQRPDWLKTAAVDDIYSLSECISKNFAPYMNYENHNGYWLFDSPAVMEKIARDNGVDLAGMTLFYYEAFEEEFDEESRRWSAFEPEPPFPTNIEKPASVHLEGFDVATFYMGNSPECSPLSCNYLATKLPVNRHCLLETSEQAKQYLEAGQFDASEPGPFRIFAVYTLAT